jgi:ABC-type polysaccharide/polyol phosphate export permease
MDVGGQMSREMSETSSPPPLVTRRSTRTGLPPLSNYIRDAWTYRTFAVHWSRADVKARNFDTFFGRVWHVINPLLFGLIYFVFVGIVGGGGFDDMERLAMIVGNLYAWLFFSGVITTSVGAVQSGAGGILTMSSIPRVVLPMASAITAANLFLRSLLAYVPIHMIGQRGLHIEMLWIPFLGLLTLMAGLGIALVMAVLNVYFRDISRLLPHVMRLWMYLSPVIWDYTRVLDSAELARLNPLYPLMTAWTIAFGGSLDPTGPGIVSQIGWSAAWSVVALVVGFLVFVSREDEFAVRN